jgi:hypothetical protein
MLKQEELTFVKALSTLKMSPALLQELKKARSSERREKLLRRQDPHLLKARLRARYHNPCKP